MQGKYKVITLCGSSHFKNEFMEAQKRLTLEGNIVISVGFFGHSCGNEAWKNTPPPGCGILHIREKNTMIMQVYSREQETSRRNFCADTDSGGPGQCLFWDSK